MRLRVCDPLWHLLFGYFCNHEIKHVDASVKNELNRDGFSGD
jgi:hypothetical protein